MASVVFSRVLERHVECPSTEVAGETVRAVLESYFEARPAVRGYVLDDTQTVRRHVTVFLNDRQVRDRTGLSDPVRDSDTVYVMQALSGG